MNTQKEKKVHPSQKSRLNEIRESLYEVIFGVDTPAGRNFDICLLWLIIFSVVAVILESVLSIRVKYGLVLKQWEWFFTIIFTIEYILRVISVRNPLKYVFSFYGLIDLFATLPTYLALVFTSIHSLLIVRALRLLRIFRILKLARFMKESDYIMSALRKSRPKITVFLGAVFTIVMIMGTIMYLVEGEEHGFTSIPRSMYWAVVTLTTVGYGDITPKTIVGQILSSIIMILGYAMIAVPTGIVSVEYANALDEKVKTTSCNVCGRADIQMDSHYCRHCGCKLLMSPKSE